LVWHAGQGCDVHSVEPVDGVGQGDGAGAGSGAAGAMAAGAGAGAGCGAGAAFGGALRTGDRFLGFAVLLAARLAVRLATTFFFALVARFAAFSTRFLVFALLFDLALLLDLADRFVFAFLAMRVAPLLR
jgi:hypothetical protein